MDAGRVKVKEHKPLHEICSRLSDRTIKIVITYSGLLGRQLALLTGTRGTVVDEEVGRCVHDGRSSRANAFALVK